MHLSLKESLLPQPPSFAKKKHYEIQELLGEGTFGKVLVSSRSFCLAFVDMFVFALMPIYYSERHGTSPPPSSP
jgi:hypothetical protein